jgi:hypothetical protein
MRKKGWRFNGQQYPNAIHMCVTRPQTQPGVVDRFRADLAEAVAFALDHRDEAPFSAAIYGGVPGGMTAEADALVRELMVGLLDDMQDLPPEPTAGNTPAPGAGTDTASPAGDVDERTDGRDGRDGASVTRPGPSSDGGGATLRPPEGPAGTRMIPPGEGATPPASADQPTA